MERLSQPAGPFREPARSAQSPQPPCGRRRRRRDGSQLQPDRYYLLGDAGSFFFDPGGDNDGFESPEAATEWARTQTVWPDLARDLDSCSMRALAFSGQAKTFAQTFARLSQPELILGDLR